ncbi:DUF349 domain-containing protein [Sodaliphilus sp.]|uniref:DUF349 domain-containing protein n=1 Tax=Sodaliphilus sp. TaxID=2815818 RepID=UPI00388FEC78
METREMSESMEQLEKDVILNSEPADAGSAVVESEENVKQGNKFAGLDKDGIINALEEALQKPVEEIKDDVAAMKAAFSLIRKGEIEKEKAEFLEKGNEESAFAIKDDEKEARFKELLNVVKEKRAQLIAEQEAVKNENLQKKQAIIEQIVAITNDPDNINRQFTKVQQLQQEFKEVGPVPATSETEIWKLFQQTNEKFYDLLKINKELRDYDFKKNLEIKQQLCADAEALDEVEDVVVAFKKLQELHDTWRETGPVAKELREDLWERFKNASSVVRKKHQAFFEERKSIEKENADAKTALCEKIEAISTDGLKTYAAWDDATKQIINLQEEWKKLGFASVKVNKTLFARFRKSCDEFFAKKAEFFKTMKEELASNLARKIELCEKAEALKDSTDWKATTDVLVALQKEWKTIGPVVKKHSDAVWKRFNVACDAFFEAKKKLNNNVHAVEHENLKQKKEVIAKLYEALAGEDTKEGAAAVRELMTQWQAIGHVPFKEKDKIYAEYREAVDKAYAKFDMKGSRANLQNFENNLNQITTDKAYHERERLVRTYETKCNELKTYENNMGFLNARSKSGNSLVKELERKIERIKEDIALLEQKIKMIDEKL